MKKGLKWTGGLVAAIVLLVGAYAVIVMMLPVGPEPQAPVSGAPAAMTDVVSRGEYLARAADCTACHTAPNGRSFAGGLSFRLPFGTIYATNITPDRETGIGNWSDDTFVKAVRQGVAPRGHLYPAMPYTSYSGMSRDDVLAIKAYLFSLPAVRQPNRENELAFPFNQRWGMAAWNLAFFRDHRMSVDGARSTEWNRGAYLATALGHCAECHTPRGLAFQLDRARGLSGESIQGWFAPNITPDGPTGLGRWSDDQLVQYLSSGHAPGRSSASGPMAEVVDNSLRHLNEADIRALVTYLRGVPPVVSDPAAAVNTAPRPAAESSSLLLADAQQVNRDVGAALFASDCTGCHQPNGGGRQSRYANLSGSTAVNDPQGHSVVQVILKGTRIDNGGWTETMPGFGGRYSDAEVAALANFITRQFGEKTGRVTEEQVRRQRQQ